MTTQPKPRRDLGAPLIALPVVVALIPVLAALALGVLTLAAGDRVFLLTLLVVDDVVALMVISFVYSDHVDVTALLVAAALLGALLAMRATAARQFRARGTSSMALYVLSIAAGVGLWLALFRSGIDPVVSGLLIGLLTNAYEPRGDAVSPNERIQTRFHPWTSLVVVPVLLAPLLALASTAVVRPRLSICAAR